MIKAGIAGSNVEYVPEPDVFLCEVFFSCDFDFNGLLYGEYPGSSSNTAEYHP